MESFHAAAEIPSAQDHSRAGCQQDEPRNDIYNHGVRPDGVERSDKHGNGQYNEKRAENPKGFRIAPGMKVGIFVLVAHNAGP